MVDLKKVLLEGIRQGTKDLGEKFNPHHGVGGRFAPSGGGGGGGGGPSLFERTQMSSVGGETWH